MSTKNNAACEAVEAAALPGASLMPSVGQIQYLACTLLYANLLNAYNWASRNGECNEEWADAIGAAEIAADCVLELKAKLPMSGGEFCTEFWKLHSVVKLAAAAFPDKESAIFRSLEAAETGFSEMFTALDLAGAFDSEGGAA